MANRLKVMWDYSAFPVWWETSGVGTRPLLPDELVADLQRWSDEWTAVMWGDDGPDAAGWQQPDVALFERHNREGRALATRVRRALPECEVVYSSDDPD